MVIHHSSKNTQNTNSRVQSSDFAATVEHFRILRADDMSWEIHLDKIPSSETIMLAKYFLRSEYS